MLSLLVCFGARDDPLRDDAEGVALGRAVVFSADDFVDVDLGRNSVPVCSPQ
jgi:hypothetical protein